MRKAFRHAVVTICLALGSRFVYADAIDDQVDHLLKQMTLDEKLALVHGNTRFSTAAIERLNIPQRWLSDGPHGVREDIDPHSWDPAGHTDDFSTAMPAMIALASTFDVDLARQYGATIGEEGRARHKDIMLGPGVNIQRTPLNGRNFEFLGEDPLLAARICVPYIQGEQSFDVASCVKHFACNNQEEHRADIDVQVDDRALHEIYLPAFEAAVKQGGVLSVMAAYNQVRGTHCAASELLLDNILRKQWGFKGFVVSDWDAVHDTKQTALHGVDLEMGTDAHGVAYHDFYLADPYKKALLAGEIPMSTLDDKARRNLYVMCATKVFDPARRRAGALNTVAHQKVSRQIAEASMVLLKNESGLLPLDAKKPETIAVIGDFANRLVCHTGGSSELKALYEVTPLAGITQRLAAEGSNVIFAQGVQQQHKRPATTMAVEATQPTTRDESEVSDEQLLRQAVAAAKSADVAIVIVGNGHGDGQDAEGQDRTSLDLPLGQDELIRRVVVANPHTAVVLETGGAVAMPWLDKVPAVLEMWYGGMEAGNALAAVLVGDSNPSGKLPCTFPKKLEDSPAHATGNYPGKDGEENYAEGIFVGYRWFDEKKIEPLFPFGFGMSYTSFAMDHLKVDSSDPTKISVSCDVKNTGPLPGAETVQVYVHEEKPSVERPPQELKGFVKVFLRPGETRSVEVPLDERALAHFDVKAQGWAIDEGRYEIGVGENSRAIHLSRAVQQAENQNVP